MHITRQEVQRIAQLARLELTESEKDAFGKQLNQVLGYVQKLKTFHTDGVDAMTTVLEQTNVFRMDEVQPSLPVEQVMANAPESLEEFFCVPRIIQVP